MIYLDQDHKLVESLITDHDTQVLRFALEDVEGSTLYITRRS